MWSSKAPPTRYEAILEAIRLTDTAISDTADDYMIKRLLSQRRELVEALVDDEEFEPDEDEENEDRGYWKCENCGETGTTDQTLVNGSDCPACKSAAINFKMD